MLLFAREVLSISVSSAISSMRLETDCTFLFFGLDRPAPEDKQLEFLVPPRLNDSVE
jgi:hypothetical protein